ncbi:MAG: hypothetical protein M1825_001906 [Sarcosagium campestre]|nr:MAG: hypothetical protein M1825_001906 [Sarcosagium campestre]
MHSSILVLAATLLGSATASPYSHGYNPPSPPYGTGVPSHPEPSGSSGHESPGQGGHDSGAPGAPGYPGSKPYPSGHGTGVPHPPAPLPPAPTPIHVTTYGPVPHPTTVTSVGSTTYYTTITTFVPCSTIAATVGTKTYYSTSLTISSYSTEVVAPTTYYSVTLPHPTEAPAAGESCPAEKTVTETVYVTVGSGAGYEAGAAHPVKTITLPNGEVTTSSGYSHPTPPVGTGSVPVPYPNNGTAPYTPGSPKPTGYKPTY